MPITYTASVLQLSGALTQLNVDNLITGSANFGFSETTVNLRNSNTVTGASLVMVALSNLEASGLGFQASGGAIGIAVIEAPAASSTTDYWFAVNGMDLSASLNLGSEITVTTGSASVAANTSENSATSGTAPPTLNWANDITQNGTEYTVNPGQLLPTPVDLTINYSSAMTATVGTSPGSSGSSAQFNIANLLSGSADFDFSETANVSVSFEGSATQVDISNATLYQVALTGLSISTAFGLNLSGADIGIAAIVPPTSSTDSRYWVAVDAEGLGGSLQLGSQLSASVSGVSVQLSLDGGSNASGGPQALDWGSDIFLSGTTTAAAINPGTSLSAGEAYRFPTRSQSPTFPLRAP